MRDGGKLFDHQLTDKIGNMQLIKSIDEDLIRERLMTTEFCEFVYLYATTVSMTKQKVKEMRSVEGFNLFLHVTDSDIAWALLLLINNRACWEWTHQETMRKGILLASTTASMGSAAGSTARVPPPRPNTRRSKERANEVEAVPALPSSPQPEEVTPSLEEQDVSAIDQPGEKPRRIWSVGGRAAQHGFAFSNEGVVFYLTFKRVFSKIPKDEWMEYWNAYWMDRTPDGGSSVRTRPARRVVEAPVRFQLDLSDDDSSDSEDEDEGRGVLGGILEEAV